MSHISRVTGLSITDGKSIVAATAALAAKGIHVELKENAIPRMWNESQNRTVGECEYVIHMPKIRFDMGFKWNNEAGEYDIIFDEFNSYVRQQIGIPVSELKASIPNPSDDEYRLSHFAQFTREYMTALTIDRMSGKAVMVGENPTQVKGEREMVLVGLGETGVTGFAHNNYM